MPVYEYKCPVCDTTFDVKASVSDPPPQCPSKNDAGEPCQGAPVKLVSKSTFILNGGGWAANGYS